MHELSLGRSSAKRRSVGAPWILWVALAVALSPALTELIRHWVREPWARESAVFVPLAIASAVADPSWSRPHGAGWLLVAAGIALALFGSAGGLAAIGRLAIPLAVIGMALATGHPAARIALIALFVVPVPFSIVSVISLAGERVVVQLAVQAARLLGADWVAGGGTIGTAAGELRLRAPDLGLPLAHLLAGMGYCTGIASGASALRSGSRGLLWAAWALPAQVLALVVSSGMLAVAGANAARAFLDVAPACAVTMIAIARLERVAHASRVDWAAGP